MERNKDPEDMNESELQKELENVYQKLNELSDKQMENLDFDGKMIIKKKNEDGEVVETRETSI